MGEKKKKLVVDGNAFYEIDLECIRKHEQKKQEHRKREQKKKFQK